MWVRMLLSSFALAAAQISAAGVVAASDADLSAIAVAMDEVLKDATSARLKDVVLVSGDTPGAYMVCGKVNAKNSYGAYAGYEPFMGMRLTLPEERYSYVVLGVGEASGKVCAGEMNK